MFDPALVLLSLIVFLPAIGAILLAFIPSEKDPSRGHRAAFPVPPEMTVLRTERAFVLVTGTRDFNRGECQAIHARMQSEGFARAAYLEVPGADHSLGLEPGWLAKALGLMLAWRDRVGQE